MNYEKLQQQWQSQSSSERVLIDKAILLRDIQRSKNDFASASGGGIYVRGIALILGGVFCYFGWRDRMWTHGLWQRAVFCRGLYLTGS